jgi:hypothetical protein
VTCCFVVEISERRAVYVKGSGMVSRCRESLSANNTVDITCQIDKCALNRSDTGQHYIDITNRRRGAIYLVEMCSVTLSGAVCFNNQPKSIQRHAIVGGAASAPGLGIILNPVPALAPAAEEITTQVEFYDATQRIGHKTFIYPKETYSVGYLMDVV